MPLRLSRVSNVMLGVRDLAAATAFYRDTLGLELVGEFPGFAFFRTDTLTLCLSQPLAKASSQLVGATEIVFAVDDVTRAHEELSARGVEFVNAPRQVTQTDWAASFVDPDGHRLSVFGPKGE
jgi:catechol 2,3-dioxygenase-like lactoylglutathione lyase family enzyme